MTPAVYSPFTDFTAGRTQEPRKRSSWWQYRQHNEEENVDQLEGKRALITGGGSGIGAAVARRFVSEGAKVCVVGRRMRVLEELVASLPVGTTMAIPGDVTRERDVERMVKATAEFAGGLDVLVNNAGVNALMPLTDMPLDVWQGIIAVNLTGPFMLMKAALPYMVKSGSGSIINVSSLGGVRCLPAMPAYNASKAGLIMLTKQVALDYGSKGIRCNVVCPGGVRTDFVKDGLEAAGKAAGKTIDEVLAAWSADVPLRRVADPYELAGICCFLASDDSSFVTGSVILADGGASVVDVAGAALTRLFAQGAPK